MMFSFSYSVTRQYPYKWFTPVAIVGMIILTVLFSAINFFSNAYIMVTTTSYDPEDSLSDVPWSRHVPGFLTSKIQPTCEDTIVLIGSTVYTNQTAFSYQLVSAGEDLSLTYGNGQIYSCEDLQISIEFQTNNGRQAAQMERSDWGVAVSANVLCTIPFPGGAAEITLSARYDPLSWAMDQSELVFTIGSQVYPGFVWAETLLLGFWAETVSAIASQTARESEDVDLGFSRYNLSSGYISFQRSGPDITDASFFSDGHYAFFDSNLQGYKGNFSDLQSLIADASWPNIWAPADRLAKAMFSAITADLGQTYRISPDMSMIMVADRVHHWTENLTDIWNESTVSNKSGLLHDGWLQMTQYNASNGEASLTFTNSSLSVDFLCQIPLPKSRFSIFISILVADLVFLRVAWTLYNFFVCYYLKYRHKDTNMCLGCAERYQDDIGTRELGIVDNAGEDTSLHGEVIELTDLARDHEEQADEQSLQKLLTRKPVGG
jgi:hypothetical protein